VADDSRAKVRALANGQTGWGQHGSAVEHERYAAPTDPRTRRRCGCCGQRATHVGCANGLALMSGCEMHVRRWALAAPPTDQPNGALREVPGLDCLTDGHQWVDLVDDGVRYGGVCTHCWTAAYDAAKEDVGEPEIARIKAQVKAAAPPTDQPGEPGTTDQGGDDRD